MIVELIAGHNIWKKEKEMIEMKKILESCNSENNNKEKTEVNNILVELNMVTQAKWKDNRGNLTKEKDQFNMDPEDKIEKILLEELREALITQELNVVHSLKEEVKD